MIMKGKRYSWRIKFGRTLSLLTIMILAGYAHADGRSLAPLNTASGPEMAQIGNAAQVAFGSASVSVFQISGNLRPSLSIWYRTTVVRDLSANALEVEPLDLLPAYTLAAIKINVRTCIDFFSASLNLNDVQTQALMTAATDIEKTLITCGEINGQRYFALVDQQRLEMLVLKLNL